MGARLGQESHAAIRYTPGNEVLTQESDRRRRLSGNKVVRESKRDPTVLPDEVAHWGVTFDASDQLVLLTSHHPPILSSRVPLGAPARRPGCSSSMTSAGRIFRQVT